MDSTPSYSAHLRALAEPALLAERRDLWDTLYDTLATPAQRRIAAKRLRLIAAERRRRAATIPRHNAASVRYNVGGRSAKR